jgi:hypothetical protein
VFADPDYSPDQRLVTAELLDPDRQARNVTNGRLSFENRREKRVNTQIREISSRWTQSA